LLHAHPDLRPAGFAPALGAPPVIRRLGPADAEEFFALRRRALEEAPLAFAASPADDLATDAAAVREQLGRAPESVVFGAFTDRLVGVVGLYRDRHLKSAHKVHLWGLYVAREARRRGVASKLMEAALAHARTLPGVVAVQLGVSEAAAEARRLYERMGFRTWGTDPDALRHGGRSVAEDWMVLTLER
jgi:ribosomal protein S18 acetylase RimI-like enzyme